MLRIILPLLFPYFSLSAFLIGNPNQPGLLTAGIISNNSSWCSIRIGYIDDYVYQQRFKDEYRIEGLIRTKTFLKLSTHAAIATLNLRNWIDLYGIVGNSRMQLDREIFTKNELSWGVGIKLAFFQSGNFAIGTDVKYFETDQKPLYFVSDGLAYNILSSYRLKYHEIQGALGMCYRNKMIVPYVHATYIISKMEPQPMVVLVRLPDTGDMTDIISKSIMGQRRWGMAVGATLIGNDKISLSVESRFFNQNAIDANCEIRF
jgi:hypothetical protein